MSFVSAKRLFCCLCFLLFLIKCHHHFRFLDSFSTNRIKAFKFHLMSFLPAWPQYDIEGVCVKPGSCWAFCTWSNMKTNHDTEVTDTSAHKQDWDPLTNHRTINSCSSDQRERAHGRHGASDNQEKSKLTERRRKTQTITPEIKKSKYNSDAEPQQRQEGEQASELWRLQETWATHKNNSESEKNKTVSTRQHDVPSNTLQRQLWENWEGTKRWGSKQNS